MKHDVWMITGCSSGFGRELATVLLERGGRVVATARDRARLDDLATLGGDRLLPLRLDVTDADEAREAVRLAIERFGRIDALVNNAGRGHSGAVEEVSDAETRALFELNVFGLLTVTRAVLPGMRARRHGAVVNIGSVAGLLARPGTGIYAATKFALEGMTQALRAELEPLGIRAMMVEPGPFRTHFQGSMTRTPPSIDDYAPTAWARIAQTAAGHGRQAGDPRRAATAIVDAIESGAPPLNLVLGAQALGLVRAELDRLRGELDAWETVSRGADFPEPAP